MVEDGPEEGVMTPVKSCGFKESVVKSSGSDSRMQSIFILVFDSKGKRQFLPHSTTASAAVMRVVQKNVLHFRDYIS